jgi:hypothetical protein
MPPIIDGMTLAEKIIERNVGRLLSNDDSTEHSESKHEGGGSTVSRIGSTRF